MLGRNSLRLIFLTFLVSFGFSSLVYAHDDVKKVPIECSTEIISSPEMVNGQLVYNYKRRTNFAIPLNFVKSHIDIPEIKFGSFQLPVIAVGKGEYKFKDVVSIPLKNEGGKLRVVDPFGVPWKTVPETDKNKDLSNVECFLVL